MSEPGSKEWFDEWQAEIDRGHRLVRLGIIFGAVFVFVPMVALCVYALAFT